MSESAILWLFGTVIGVMTLAIGGIVGWIFHHSRDCQEFRVNNAEFKGETKTDIKRVKEDIGDRDSGIRGWLHELANDISPWLLKKQSERHRRDDT